MSLATETDPVETVRLILDDETVAGDWSNAGEKPGLIDRSEDHEPSRKLNRDTQDALYIWSPVDGDLQKFGAGGDNIDQTETIQVEVWTPVSATKANQYVADIIDIVTDYTNDNATGTQWVDIWPTTVSDNTAQSFQGSHYVITVLVELRAMAAT